MWRWNISSNHLNGSPAGQLSRPANPATAVLGICL